MTGTILIEGRLAGSRRKVFTDWWMELPPLWERGGDRLRLRDLITRVVHEEVQAFETRRQERRLERLLGREEIDAAARQGRVDPAAHEAGKPVDVEAAIATALQAYEDGLYFVFIDEVQAGGLDSEVVVRPGSKMTFIRLVALTGG